MEKGKDAAGGRAAYPALPEEEQARIRALAARKAAERQKRPRGDGKDASPHAGGREPGNKEKEAQHMENDTFEAWDESSSPLLNCTTAHLGGMEFRFSEDWTDYEAIMKEHPDLFSYDAKKDEWSLTEKGKKANGDISKGELNAYIVLSNYEEYKKFPEDRVGGVRWLTVDEIAARGWLIM